MTGDKMDEDDREDVEELKEVMNILKNTVPDMIKGIVDALYSGNNAEEFGKQVANFYKSMIDAGMDKKEAFELTKEFMESRDVVGVLKDVLSKGNFQDMKNIKDMGKEMKKARKEMDEERKEEE
jgi:hypothetical protein